LINVYQDSVIDKVEDRELTMLKILKMCN